ncbi:hypothetical protein [Deinococcus hohokamensis]|uniref:DUF4333 domain-containing protein n=1 Tax=Deinococcus hohokamensis TaxID=309883 RepID=A0ABV9IDJ7_9DEIO
MTAPHPPLREITPEQRRRTQRTFVWILVGFVAGIGIMVATLSAGGRAVRDYGQGVLDDVRRSGSWGVPGNAQECSEVSNRRAPPGVTHCMVERHGQNYVVVLQIEGDRQYRVGP